MSHKSLQDLPAVLEFYCWRGSRRPEREAGAKY